MADEDTGVTARERWLEDRAHRAQELELKQKELALREREVSAPQWRSPLVLALIAATIAALGNGWVAYFNGHAQRELEAQKAEETRILEMLKTGNPSAALANLRFLADIKLVTNPDVRDALKKYLANPPQQSPFLPPSTNAHGETNAHGDAQVVELHVNPADLRVSLGQPFCFISSSKTLAYCHHDSLLDCQAARNAMPDTPFKQHHECGARPATATCFAYHSIDRLKDGPPLLLSACFTDHTACEANRVNYRSIPGVLDVATQCEDIAMSF